METQVGNAGKPLSMNGLRVSYSGDDILSNLDLEIAAGEFVAVLGPSGCGKSTLLRAIAGLVPADDGTIRLGERTLDEVPPAGRRIALVFQSYALYPHMSVAENLAAPLRLAQLPPLGRLPLIGKTRRRWRRTGRQIEERVAQTARQLKIEPLLARRPSALSGGQQQRVALGRAMIRQPDLFLLDEPLANLDATLRLNTRAELRRLQRALSVTTIFVTHDQAEAMAIADRIVVMFDGRIRQIGTPDALYRHPADLDVARFLSQPALNVFEAKYLRRMIGSRTSQNAFTVGGHRLDSLDGIVALRPEDCHLRPASMPGLPGIPVTVEHAEHGGRETYVFARTPEGLPAVARIASADFARWSNGSAAILHFERDAAHVFDARGTRAPLAA